MIGSIGGKVWLAGHGKHPAWLRNSGVAVLPDGERPGTDDCVLHLDGSDAPELPAMSEWERRLKREGLRVARSAEETREAGQAHTTRSFTATVFDLEATDVRRVRCAAGGKRRVPERTEPDDRLRRIIVRAAVRAVYALGLDFGQVEVDLDGAGRPVIVGLSSVMRPYLTEGEFRTAQAVRAFADCWKAETAGDVSATLGADPEFVLMSPDGKVVPASKYFTRDGAAGCDSVVVRGVRVWPLVELRPEPAAEPRAVAVELRRLLAAAAWRCREAPELAWRAGAWPVRGLPLGGHVHVSGAALTGERLRALDNAVALPLRLLEPPTAAARRPRYGALGDFRRQPHGGFEYRTPPSWLVSPGLTRGVLALAKIAAEHSRELAADRPLDDDALRDAFYSDREEERHLLRAAALRFFDALTLTAGYRKYSADVDFVIRAVRDRRRWDETADIRLKWGIPIQ